MKTCKHDWCEEEIHLPLGDGVALAHRAVIETVAIAGDTVSVTLGAVDDGPPYVLVEATEEGSSMTTVVTSASGREACQLAAGLLNAVDRASLLDDEDENGDRLMWDLDDLGATLRARVADEQAEHGPDLWSGPFDTSPFGLASLVTGGFFVSHGSTERAASWLLSKLAARNIETGHIDLEIVREAAEVLGADAVQVIGGWVERAQP